ncbi:MAG: hypothetical protein NTU47_01785 [Ignavibacteriales bacterium]|nr:hypothetical protein [Ignavibacteriales bacterium]
MRTKIKFTKRFAVRMMVPLLVILMAACDLVDPSKVENPAITSDNLLENPVGGTTSLVTGMRRYYSNMIGISSFIGDLVSDNLDNRTSFYDNTLSFPRTISGNSFTYGPMYENALQVNALADFGIKSILPGDIFASNDQKAEVYFYKGMALLILGEGFTNFPITEKGPAVTAHQALQTANDQFQTAFNLTTQTAMKTNCRMARARTFRMLGDKANAVAEANAALALGGSTYLFAAQYDPAQLTSTTYAAMVGRSTNDIQPLPRLDFLDPKYNTNGTQVPVLKAEEAYLILAEVSLANGDLAGTKTYMKNAITTARGRATVTYNDKDTRPGHPNDAAMVVKSDASDPAIAGLIQKRGGASIVTIYSTSGTSVTTAMVDTLSSVYSHFRTLYLLRQEIFFLEGRRMIDLGIRLPVTQRQIDGNPNITPGSPGTTVVVPDYIPATDEMRRFTTSGTTVTILWDMNKVLAANRSRVSPFNIQ